MKAQRRGAQRTILLAVALAGFPAPAAIADPGSAATPPASGLVVQVSGIRIKRGSGLELLVYASDRDREANKAVTRQKVPLAAGSTKHTFVIPNLPAGRYMIAGIQDANDNNELDTSWIGLPKEGYFTSHNKRMPNWDDCSFNYDGRQLALDVKMIYW